MKILLVSNGFQPNYEKAFANGLAENAISCVLVGSDRTLTAELAPNVLAINLRGSQDPRRSFIKKGINILRYAFALFRHIRNSRYDIVHLTGLFMTRSVMLGVVEWSIYRVFAKSFFMTVHNILPHERHMSWTAALYQLIYRLPHRLVVHTEKMKYELIAEFGINPDRIIVMPHGVDSIPATMHVPPPSSVLRVLLFGSLSHYKGVDLFLAGLSFCRDLDLDVTIVGEARDEAYAHVLERLISTVERSQQIRWVRGYVPENAVQGYFESSDVVVLPYRRIDQSGVLFTAFRFGVPVIATDVGSFREYIPSSVGLVVDRPDPKLLADALREFRRRRESFDRATIQSHAENLAWPKTVLPLIGAYKEAIQGVS